ncbi:transketolase [Microbacterium sp. NPDC058342]|uniref:transketolase n=1 Tax=Microbacterium sp. NPDC058342 TaxID=3346454 RepID=UPI003652CBFF
MASPTTPVRSDAELADLAARARLHVLETVASSKAGHIGGPMSAMDLLISLYFDRLRIDPARPDWPERDRFILSKGHSAIGLYAVLALRGFFPVEELLTFDHGDSRLQGHPDMLLTPGVDSSTGSLGQGLAMGTGIALASQKRRTDVHTWVLCGDGELQEGMIWESVIMAPRYRLDNLTLIVDNNGLQQFGWPSDGTSRFDRSEPMGHVDLVAALRAFGWEAEEIDGHDLEDIRAAFDRAEARRGTGAAPTAIIARTMKGRGVSFTQGHFTWHNGVPSPEQLALARAELLGPAERMNAR